MRQTYLLFFIILYFWPVKLAIEEIFSEYMLQGGHNKKEETDNGMPIKLIIANIVTLHRLTF